MSDDTPKFSVLMAIYIKDSPLFLSEALQSIYKNTVAPDEVIIIRDGKVTSELNSVIDSWRRYLNIKDFTLEKNMGLGAALNFGLNQCMHDLVIRADSDDINRTNRFECILDFMTKNGDVHILSSWVEEFEFNPGDKGIIKKVPSRNSILKYSKNRSPFNHPAVAFKKCEIMRVGGYGNEYLYEDYALWLKSLANGCNGDNIQQVLVDMRFSKETAKRRGGIKYAISEIKAQYHFYRANYISYQDFIIIIITRIFVRLLPTSFRGYIYKKVIRRFL